jgi:hypothetical protein
MSNARTSIQRRNTRARLEARHRGSVAADVAAQEVSEPQEPIAVLGAEVIQLQGIRERPQSAAADSA